jgi:hypothetical protein
MSMPKKSLTVQLPAQTIIVLEILCKKLKRSREDLTLEAFNYIFQEYKEVICHNLEKFGLKGKIDPDKFPRRNICLADNQRGQEVKKCVCCNDY